MPKLSRRSSASRTERTPGAEVDTVDTVSTSSNWREWRNFRIFGLFHARVCIPGTKKRCSRTRLFTHGASPGNRQMQRAGATLPDRASVGNCPSPAQAEPVEAGLGKFTQRRKEGREAAKALPPQARTALLVRLPGTKNGAKQSRRRSPFAPPSSLRLRVNLAEFAGSQVPEGRHAPLPPWIASSLRSSQ